MTHDERTEARLEERLFKLSICYQSLVSQKKEKLHDSVLTQPKVALRQEDWACTPNLPSARRFSQVSVLCSFPILLTLSIVLLVQKWGKVDRSSRTKTHAPSLRPTIGISIHTFLRLQCKPL